MTRIHQFKALSIGCLAADVLTNEREATVFGSSLGGIYLKTSAKWLFYLSFERFRGPLTINLKAAQSEKLAEIQVSDRVRLSERTVCFSRTGCEIRFDESLVWHPNAASKNATLLDGNCEAARKLLAKRKNSDAKQRTDRQRETVPNSTINQVQQALTQQDTQQLENALISLLGYGIGLTPCGDDFVIGLLLRLNRIGEGWLSKTERERLNHSLVGAAYKRTNLISANLIECAAMGLADERLINALDWLTGGEQDDLGAIEELLGWGHSSGAAVLEGFLING